MTRPVEGAALVFVLACENPMQRRLSICSNEFVGYEFDDCDQGGEVGRVIPGCALFRGATPSISGEK